MNLKPWTQKWLHPLTLEAADSAASLRHSLRKVKVEFIDVEPGVVKAKMVQGKQKPCFIKLVREPLSGEIWGKIVRELSKESVWAAGLSAREWPEGMERVFEKFGARVFPRSLREFKIQCSAHDDSQELCRHAFWVWLLFADRFEEDPLLLLSLWGRKGSDVLSALQQAQSQEMKPGGSPASGAEISQTPFPVPGPFGFRGTAVWARHLKEDAWLSSLTPSPFEWKEKNLRDVLQGFSERIRKTAGERLDSFLKDEKPSSESTP